ncbi:MAG: hypothetical protein SGPRY_009698 [Prymnesium sp.]
MRLLMSMLAIATAAVAPSRGSYDLLIIGGGSAGLTAAKFASNFGKSVAIIEKARMGGDCTWTGCVPSKTLLAIAKRAHSVRTACDCDYLGLPSAAELTVDMAAVKAKVKATVEKIYDEDDSPAALSKLGIDTITGAARFLDQNTLSIEQADGSLRVSAQEGIIIATGASPTPFNIPGIDDVGFITYEEVFELDELPKRLTVVGGGPIGCELSQAFSRLGSQVTVIAPRLLPNEEPEVGEVMSRVFEKECITLVQGRANSVTRSGDEHTLSVSGANGEVQVTGDMLLVATGRRPVVDGMDLERIGVELKPTGGIQASGQRPERTA